MTNRCQRFAIVCGQFPSDGPSFPTTSKAAALLEEDKAIWAKGILEQNESTQNTILGVRILKM